MPTHHRVRAEKDGDPAKKVKGRRTSDIIIAQNLRRYVTEWRETDYAGASDTTRESYSPMTRHFVVIAPNITVFERLKEDFGDGIIFDKDPLIPVAWRGDWNLSVVLQDKATWAATGGTLYLTNIHRLYDTNKRKGKKDSETYDWMGPSVSKAKALDTGEELRERITSHKRVMVINDEAHHVWDPDSAWNEAINYLNDTIRKRGGDGICAQLDFSATPKDNKGNLFKHVRRAGTYQGNLCAFNLGKNHIH